MEYMKSYGDSRLEADIIPPKYLYSCHKMIIYT